MSSHRKQQGELVRLRAALHAAHDNLHQGNVDAAHTALHCQDNGDTPVTGNVTTDAAAGLAVFMHKFNALCLQLGMPAACVVIVPSATKSGYGSMQIGGHVPTIQAIREMMGKPPTLVAQ